MSKTKLMKLIYLKSEYESISVGISIGIKIPFFFVSVAIEPGHSSLTVCYHELFDIYQKYRTFFFEYFSRDTKKGL